MESREAGQKLYVVVGSPWKDALLGFLSDEAPDNHWEQPAGLRRGDLVLAVLKTAPVTLLCLERVVDSGPRRLQVSEVWDWPWLPDLEEVEAVSGVKVPRREGLIADADADRLLAVLASIGRQYPVPGSDSATRARVLAASDLTCAGCEEPIDLAVEKPAEQVHVYTPADGGTARHVLCTPCNWEARSAGASTMVELKYAVNPACPQCGAKRTRAIAWGMPAEPPPSWVAIGGCCIGDNDPIWSCGECAHSWGL